ncbi:MAG: M81 family metallopeptidase [Oscillospiraceae bacterium]|nr:M81 family metallopeptidase [Oscillospiraceae bacterium]MCL2278932.1 M81 family metallopeptidase [Oscillospiraceae bacterium]
MKIALAGMGHESNTFNKECTELSSFVLIDGDDFCKLRNIDSSANGFYETLKTSGADVAPLFFASAIPSGTVRRDAYDYIKSSIITKLRDGGAWDAVCLALHGSMAVEGLYDPEGDLLEAVRSVIGNEIPIVCALDMHATLTEQMALCSDGFSVFRTAPHIDSFDTGKRGAEIMLKILKEKRKTVNVLVKIPILVSGEQSETRVEPAKALFESLTEYDKLPDVLCASYVMGFPWADSPFGGAGALVTGWSDGEKQLKDLADKMSKIFWDKRAEFTFSTPAMQSQEAIEAALCATEFPVIISDSADNPTAGASQDTTQLLRLMIESGMENAVYTCVADAKAYKQCASRTIGDEFSIALGGRTSKKASERLEVYAKLKNLAKIQGTSYAVMQAKGVKFVVSDKRCATYYPETLRELGLEPTGFNVIGIKAGYLSPEYQDISKLSILALTEGDTALELKNLPYKKTPRPIYPLD